MPKISFEKIIKADIKKVYKIFSNYEDYDKLAPQHYTSIRVRSVRDNVAVVEEHLLLGQQEFVMMAKHISDVPFSHEVFVIGGDAKGSHIKEEFTEHSQGTKVVVYVDLKLKGKMKLSLLFGKNNFEENYSKLVDDFVKLASN